MYKPELNVDNKPLIGEPGYKEMILERFRRRFQNHSFKLFGEIGDIKIWETGAKIKITE